jgi:hypothetical protein
LNGTQAACSRKTIAIAAETAVSHKRNPGHLITGLGLYCLLEAKVTETASLRNGANH